jgi:ABC-2 type transport system ATP-binding protein
MIQIRTISLRYHRRNYSSKNLSLNLPQGSINGLLGRNGAGKSNVAEKPVGLLFPTTAAI